MPRVIREANVDQDIKRTMSKKGMAIISATPNDFRGAPEWVMADGDRLQAVAWGRTRSGKIGVGQPKGRNLKFFDTIDAAIKYISGFGRLTGAS